MEATMERLKGEVELSSGQLRRMEEREKPAMEMQRRMEEASIRSSQLLSEKEHELSLARRQLQDMQTEMTELNEQWISHCHRVERSPIREIETEGLRTLQSVVSQFSNERHDRTKYVARIDDLEQHVQQQNKQVRTLEITIQSLMAENVKLREEKSILEAYMIHER
jgi:uncharacterized protein (DUF3084 family)